VWYVYLLTRPYCIGKAYERSKSLEDFIAAQKQVLPEIARITKEGGSICWEIGYHVKNACVYPLDYEVLAILRAVEGIVLRNRIIWTFGHGVHGRNRFSGRHEIVMWFTKGDDYAFDLDAVREPQKYPGKRLYNGPRKGQYSGNPKGKNPSDVWSIPNVKAKHVEKLAHPCQFPVGLADRLVRSLCPQSGLVFDPYMGSASSGVAAIINGRRFLGAEIKKSYMNIATQRLAQAYAGTLPYRPVDKPIFVPGPGLAVARRPEHFVEHIK
jgi:adenine-specific DNA-methyltransferase